MTKTLESLIKKNNTILLKEDYSCEMAEVELNGSCVFMGNFWDYHMGCEGRILPKAYDWEGRYGFVNALEKYIQDKRKKVVIKKIRYKYED